MKNTQLSCIMQFFLNNSLSDNCPIFVCICVIGCGLFSYFKSCTAKQIILLLLSHLNPQYLKGFDLLKIMYMILYTRLLCCRSWEIPRQEIPVVLASSAMIHLRHLILPLRYVSVYFFNQLYEYSKANLSFFFYTY